MVGGSDLSSVMMISEKSPYPVNCYRKLMGKIHHAMENDGKSPLFRLGHFQVRKLLT